MRRKKWKTVTIWVLSFVIVLCIGGAFTANYAVDKLLDSMIEEIDLDLETNLTDDISNGTSLEVNNSSETKDGTSLEVGNSPNSDYSGNKNGSNGTIVNQNEKNLPNNQGVEKETLTDKEKNKEANKNPDSVESYTPDVSTGKMVNIKESVTIKDKAYVTGVLLQSLDLASIKRLQELAKGGLTVEEKKEARSIIMDKVTPDQYNELSNIGRKYGVSEGRNYDQIKKSLGDD